MALCIKIVRSGQVDTTRQLGSKKGPEPPEPPRFGSDLTDLVADLLGVSGHKAVLSSCFESGIALAHLAILASILVRRGDLRASR